ncbi:class I SAM-dependent methyltransferase [Zobellia galactanivorans]|uniref:class I SAM-dependent methyltransferase n=1 Tax=Zobellia galactanivorans (strain DSM 12802 / CCUG 47099 / CIP 106680 / NCIMB 13871 / Dsij) TaxID=63186 RepID=UPI001C07CBC8|nr:class I SAM-dependent methyltransferase [Zobellia galactanivorans]MBU3024950.1 class I SAM-dependent methyltransferase [Zobellia galactanivorans]MDO6808752.1 class I SAM-dependent methyltransferase [Zobellia galactanivorans]
MSEFWEDSFLDKQEMWGFKPAKSALLALDFFDGPSVKNILIPGIGYGRNAQIFRSKGIQVTGIEISKTAIELARKHFGEAMVIHHGSVTDMPFDDKKYDGIFCHALIHLLNPSQRAKLIRDCYDQLADKGHMVFTAITKTAPNFGKGKLMGKDCYEFHQGVPIFFYDTEAVKAEFDKVGLCEIIEVDENQPMFLIRCKKA